MPGAQSYPLDINSKESKPIEDAWLKEFKQRQSDIETAWNYFNGEQLQPLKPDKSKVNDNVIVNLCGLLVEKSVSFLFGTDEIGEVEGLEFRIAEEEIEEEPPKTGIQGAVSRMVAGAKGAMAKVMGTQTTDEEPETPMTEALEAFWKANKKNALLHDIGLNGSNAGHCFVKIKPADDECKYIRLVNLDPKYVGVFWDEGDIDRVLWYRIEYEGITQTRREDTVRRDGPGGATWEIIEYTRERKPNGGQSKAQWIERNRTAWPYSWAPIIDWKNLPKPNQFYGAPDLGKTGQRLNDSLNFTASNIQRILKHHATPKTVGTGFSASEMAEADIGGLWVIRNENAKITNLEMQSDLVSSLNFANMVRGAMFAGARELDPTTVQDKLGAITNFGLRVLFKDTLGKNTTKRLHYGDGLRRVCQYVLELDGFMCEDINVEWPDPLPSDPLPTAQALQIDVAVGGLSKDTYLRRRGYDPDQERMLRQSEQMEDQQNATLTSQSQGAGMVETLGSMLKKIRGGGQEPGDALGNAGAPQGGAIPAVKGPTFTNQGNSQEQTFK
jgi:hypothetical protein